LWIQFSLAKADAIGFPGNKDRYRNLYFSNYLKKIVSDFSNFIYWNKHIRLSLCQVSQVSSLKNRSCQLAFRTFVRFFSYHYLTP
jgi:hypothetical protein